MTVALTPPLAPVITSPANAIVTNDATLNLEGTAEAKSEVQLYLNGAGSGALISVDDTGRFASAVSLVEGSNSITAAAQNRGGMGQQSPPVSVTLDSSVPATPTGLIAQARAGGEVRLVWEATSDDRTVGFHVYRSTQPFTAVSEATQANSNLITDNTYIDLPPTDGLYYYRVIAVNQVDTPSNLSNQANVTWSNRLIPPS